MKTTLYGVAPIVALVIAVVGGRSNLDSLGKGAHPGREYLGRHGPGSQVGPAQRVAVG
jgi:hypothetical protein